MTHAPAGSIRAPITSKLHMGSFLLAGKAFDKGNITFQDFNSLVKLRNEIVHQKPFEGFTVDQQDSISQET
jgi:hypothetical protein